MKHSGINIQSATKDELKRYSIEEERWGERFRLIEAICTNCTANGWITLRIPGGKKVNIRSNDKQWFDSRLIAIDCKIKELMQKDFCWTLLDPLQELFELRSRYREEWRMCPCCERLFEREQDDACEHVVAAYSLDEPECEVLEEFGPLPIIQGRLKNKEVVGLVDATSKLLLNPYQAKDNKPIKRVPRRLSQLLGTLQAEIRVDEGEYYCSTRAQAFHEYLEALITRGPTFQKVESYEVRYGYGTYDDVVYWAENAKLCADYVRREIRSDIVRLKKKSKKWPQPSNA